MPIYVLGWYIAGVRAVSDANNVSRLSNGIAGADDMIWLMVNLKPDANDWHSNQGIIGWNSLRQA